MYRIEIEMLTLAEAAQRYAGQMPVEKIATEVEAAEGVAIEAKIDEFWASGREAAPTYTLFLWLPPQAQPSLRSLGRCRFFEYNAHSADLHRCTTYLELDGGVTRVRINAWHLDSFPGELATPEFRVVLVAADSVVVATHRPDEEALESLLGGLQACCAGSGPNYRPWRIWSDEEMAAAEGRPDAPEAGLVEAVVCTLKDDRQLGA